VDILSVTKGVKTTALIHAQITVFPLFNGLVRLDRAKIWKLDMHTMVAKSRLQNTVYFVMEYVMNCKLSMNFMAVIFIVATNDEQTRTQMGH